MGCSTRHTTCLRRTLLLALLTWASFSACGKFGERDDFDTVMSMGGGTGCLNDLGPMVAGIQDGHVDETKWKTAWSCVDDTLNLFTRYVKGEVPNGYSRADIQALVRKFLITNGREVKSDFISSLFDLKSTLFGGDPQVLSKDEIERFRKVSQFLRTETLKLLPHFRNRTQDPTPANLLAMADAVARFGDSFAQQLEGMGAGEIPQASVVKFIEELQSMHRESGQPRSDTAEWVAFFLQAKALLLHGSEGKLMANEWPELIRIGTRLGGAYLAYQSYPTDQSADEGFLIQVSSNGVDALKDVLANWDGKIPYDDLKKLIQVAPASMLPPRTEEVRAAAGATLAPVLEKVLKSGTPGFLNLNAIQSAVAFYHAGLRGQAHVKNIYAGSDVELTPAQFIAKADAYAAGLNAVGKAEVNRLKGISLAYLGFFREKTLPAEIYFSDMTLHSRNNLIRLNWFEHAARLLLQGYGTDRTGVGWSGDIEQLAQVVTDYRKLLLSISMVHPDVCDVHKKRFREANVFMPPSNGDLYMDMTETTTYLAFLFSSGSQSSRVKTTLFEPKTRVVDGVEVVIKPAVCAQVDTDPDLKTPRYDIGCFRREYFRRVDDLWSTYPKLLALYRGLSSSAQSKLQLAMEAAARRLGVNEDPISGFDVDAYAGVAHYVESVMRKFDKRGTPNVLSRSEILYDAEPVFENEILGLVDSPAIKRLPASVKTLTVKIVLLYIMQHGSLFCKDLKHCTGGEIWDAVKWLLFGGPFKSIAADRTRIYDVFASLSNMSLLDPKPTDQETGRCIDSSSSSQGTGLDDLLNYLPGSL